MTTTTKRHLALVPPADVIVRATPMLPGSALIVYTAWEPAAGHSMQTRFDGVGGYWGRIGSKVADVDPVLYPYGSAERTTLVVEAYRAEKLRAIDAILDLVPDLYAFGRIDWSAGEISASVEDMDR